MMNFTSSVSDLECLLLKFKASQDFTNALKVANILGVIYAGDRDPKSAAFLTMHFALHLIENDLEGARYLWKRIPSNIKVDESSELFHLWTVNKYLIGNDTTNALTVLLERSKDFTGAECGAWEVLGPELASELILRLRSHQAESILSSYDVITLDSAAAMLQLSKEDCKQELLNRGCEYDAERDVMLTSSTHRQKTAIVFDNGDLLQTLTECVAQLERKPLSVNIKNEIENAKKRNAACEKAEIMEY